MRVTGQYIVQQVSIKWADINISASILRTSNLCLHVLRPPREGDLELQVWNFLNAI